MYFRAADDLRDGSGAEGGAGRREEAQFEAAHRGVVKRDLVAAGSGAEEQLAGDTDGGDVIVDIFGRRERPPNLRQAAIAVAHHDC